MFYDFNIVLVDIFHRYTSLDLNMLPVFKNDLKKISNIYF